MSRPYGTFPGGGGGADAPAHGERPPRGWDYVFAFAAGDGGGGRADATRAAVLRRLRAAGFSYEQRWVPSGGRVLVCLGLSDAALLEKAEAAGMELELAPRYGGGFLAFRRDRAACFVRAGRPDGGPPCLSTSDVVLLTRRALAGREAWGAGIDADRLVWRGEMLQRYAVHRGDERGRLLRAAVCRPWHAPLGEATLLQVKRYLGARVALYVAFVSFYARYLRGISALAVLVTIVQCLTASRAVVAATRCLFGLAVVFWATYFLEHWKRRNAVLNVKWGLSDVAVEAESEVRPQFRGKERKGFWCGGGFVHLDDLDADGRGGGRPAAGGPPGPERAARAGAGPGAGAAAGGGGIVIGGSDRDALFKVEAAATGVKFSDLPAHPMCGRREMSRRVYVGVATTGLFTAAVGLLTLALLYYRLEMIVALSHGPLAALAPLAPGVATGVLISCADAAWRAASVRLTRWENHRTDRSHDNHLVLKRFAFQFVSNYSSLLYIGFVKPHTPGDACLVGADGATPDCMMELRSQLIGIVLTKATVMQLVEVGVPYAAGRLKLWMQRAARESFEEGASAAERARVGAAAAGSGDDDKYLNEGRLAVADDLDDYGEVTIMYGYFCLFGLCWPLAALVQLVDVSVESRSDVFKIVAVSQMPDARDAGDIGLWIPIMEFLRTLSIITNASLVIFTGRALDDVLPAGWDASPVLAFLVLEHLLFCVKWAISSTVNEVPGRTRRLLARQEFLIARCFGHGWKSHFRPRDWDARPPPDQFAPPGGADAP